MDKKLALAFDFKNAPAAVQDAGKKHRDNWLKLEKATDQEKKWRQAKIEAQRAYEQSERDFTQAIDAWDPVAKKNQTPEEKA